MMRERFRALDTGVFFSFQLNQLERKMPFGGKKTPPGSSNVQSW